MTVVVRAATALGIAVVDTDEGELVDLADGTLARDDVTVDLPLLVAADRCGARIVAVVDRRPPLVVSDDAGSTWREAGSGLPPGRAVAISREHPDDVVFATETRLYVSRDGARFWSVLPVELLGITAVTVEPG